MIDVKKFKADIEAAKSAAEAVLVGIKAARDEATALRLAHGGAGQPVIDELVAGLDAAAASLAPEPKPAPKS